MNILIIIASLVLAYVPILYLQRTAKGPVTPNPTTFFLRSVVSVMNLVTYFLTVNHSMLKSSVSLVSTVGLVSIFVYTFWKGKFSALNYFDIASGAVAIVVAIFWKMSSDPIRANLYLQVAMLISFAPSIRGVLNGKNKEERKPWVLATLAYVLMTLGLLLDPKTSLEQMVHPIFVGILGNGSLMYAVIRKKELDEKALAAKR